MRNDLFIGIDAGGTKIEIVGCRGETKHVATFPSVNARKAPLEDTIRCVSTAVSHMLDLFGHAKSNKDMSRLWVCAGIAGAASPDLQRAISRGVSEATGIPLNQLVVESDARIAFEAAFKGSRASDTNLLVICGTGSGCYSFDEDLGFLRTGGWGPLIGDPGSGTELGKQFLKEVLSHAEQHRYSMFTEAFEAVTVTSLPLLDHTEAYVEGADRLETPPKDAAENSDRPRDNDITNQTGFIPSIAQVLDWTYQPHRSLSSLARVLLDLARSDDRANQLITRECDELAIQIERLARILHSKNPSIKLTGGLNGNSIYSTLLIQSILHRLPLATVNVSERKPVEGAMVLATAMVQKPNAKSA